MITLLSCKNKNEIAVPMQMIKLSDCISLVDFDKLTTNADQVAWLKKSGSLVCHSILYEREIIHKVLPSEVEISSSAKPYVMDWQTFEKLIGSTVYQNYVGFEQDTVNNVTKVILVPNYLEKGTTYSVPLFRSIGIKYKFTSKTKIEFVRALVKDDSKIVIRFKDEKNAFVYYENSRDPI